MKGKKGGMKGKKGNKKTREREMGASEAVLGERSGAAAEAVALRTIDGPDGDEAARLSDKKASEDVEDGRKETGGGSKVSGAASRLQELKMRLHQARNLNTKEVAEEKERRAKDPREASRRKRTEDRRKEKLETRALKQGGAVFTDRKRLEENAALAEAREVKRARKRVVPEGETIFGEDNLRGAFERRLETVPKYDDQHLLQQSADEINYGRTPVLPEENINNMVAELETTMARREKFSRRRAFHEDRIDIDFINERNRKFNKKISRAFDAYTGEVKQSLERDLALTRCPWRGASNIVAAEDFYTEIYGEAPPLGRISGKLGCWQCAKAFEETRCKTFHFACGKLSDVAAAQDTLLEVCRGLAQFSHTLRINEVDVPKQCVEFLPQAITATAPNVNFSLDRVCSMISDGLLHRELLVATFWDRVQDRAELPIGAAQWLPKAMTPEGIVFSGEPVSLPARMEKMNPDILSMVDLLTSVVKGLCANVLHSLLVVWLNPQLATTESNTTQINDTIFEALGYCSQPNLDIAKLHELLVRCAKMNYQAMSILYMLNTHSFGEPTQVKVRTSPVAGKAILVSGDDLTDLEAVLFASEDQPVNVYTHGDLLAAHSYPKLRAHPHLVGHYGGAWHQQEHEFEDFPGPIMVTSGSFVPPRDSYKDRIFTSGYVGASGTDTASKYGSIAVSKLLLRSQKCEGFTRSEKATFTTIGASMEADSPFMKEILEGVRSKRIRHVFVVGGCDGEDEVYSYFTKFVEMTPEDSVILTLGSTKFRVTLNNSLASFGNIPGSTMPRIVHCGQMSDCYSILRFVDSLRQLVSCCEHLDEVPLSFVLSWYEHRSMATLFTLLAHNVRNVYLGPRAPAFLSHNVMEYLRQTYNVRLTYTPEEDLKEMLDRIGSGPAELDE